MWDKARFALFPSWQLQCQVGWVGEEQAGVPQLPAWDRVVCRAGVSQSSVCHSLCPVPMPAHTPGKHWRAVSPWKCSVCRIQGTEHCFWSFCDTGGHRNTDTGTAGHGCPSCAHSQSSSLDWQLSFPRAGFGCEIFMIFSHASQ